MRKRTTVFTGLAGMVLLGLYQDAAYHLRAKGAGQRREDRRVHERERRPMDTNHVLPDQTVIVTEGSDCGGRPAAKIKVPEGATIVDSKGKFLMPGLAEMHGHIPPPTQPKGVCRQRAVSVRGGGHRDGARHAGRAGTAGTARSRRSAARSSRRSSISPVRRSPRNP